MKKKFGIILIFVIAIVIGGRIYFSNVKKEETKKEFEFKNINSIKLYSRSFKGDKISEYSEMELSSSSKDNLIKELKDYDVKYNSEKIIYGKYKLVIDDYVFYFDDTKEDIVTYNDKTISFPLNIFENTIKNDENCSCCSEGIKGCQINICSCE